MYVVARITISTTMQINTDPASALVAYCKEKKHHAVSGRSRIFTFKMTVHI